MKKVTLALLAAGLLIVSGCGKEEATTQPTTATQGETQKQEEVKKEEAKPLTADEMKQIARDVTEKAMSMYTVKDEAELEKQLKTYFVDPSNIMEMAKMIYAEEKGKYIKEEASYESEETAVVSDTSFTYTARMSHVLTGTDGKQESTRPATYKYTLEKDATSGNYRILKYEVLK